MKMQTAALLLLVALFTAAISAQTYPVGLTNPVGVFTPYNSSSYNMGYAFTTTQSNVTVTHLAGTQNDTAAKIVC